MQAKHTAHPSTTAAVSNRSIRFSSAIGLVTPSGSKPVESQRPGGQQQGSEATWQSADDRQNTQMDAFTKQSKPYLTVCMRNDGLTCLTNKCSEKPRYGCLCLTPGHSHHRLAGQHCSSFQIGVHSLHRSRTAELKLRGSIMRACGAFQAAVRRQYGVAERYLVTSKETSHHKLAYGPRSNVEQLTTVDLDNSGLTAIKWVTKTLQLEEKPIASTTARILMRRGVLWEGRPPTGSHPIEWRKLHPDVRLQRNTTIGIRKRAHPVAAAIKLITRLQPTVTSTITPLPRVRVVHETLDLVVFDKPRGMAIHRDASHPHKSLVEVAMAMGERDGFKPRVVHRLDRLTSGLVVMAKHGPAARALHQAFRDKVVKKLYFCRLDQQAPNMPPAAWHEWTILSHRIPTQPRDVVAMGAKAGLRPYDVLREFAHADSIVCSDWLRRQLAESGATNATVYVRHLAPSQPVSIPCLCRKMPECAIKGCRFCGQSIQSGSGLTAMVPITGRKHQLRVQAAIAGSPIRGDPIYGDKGSHHQFTLHSAALQLPSIPATATATGAEASPTLLRSSPREHDSTTTK